MKRTKVKFRKGVIGRVRIVEDFLPSPDKLTLLTDEQIVEVRHRIGDPDRVLLSRPAARKRIKRG
jgi:hypothetical protein